jgi:hypothetical protein
MTSESLKHDVAWATSMHIVQLFAGCLREEELRDAFAEVYAQVKTGLENFQIRDDRMQRRLRPCMN